MKLYLYYSYGWCNEGDHSYGVEEFKTLTQLRLRLDELIDDFAMGEKYITYKIIVGTLIEDHP
jgi:hypothetical protein